MIKRNRNQLIYAANMPDRWLRTAVAVSEPDPARVLLRCWQGSLRMSADEAAQSPKKLTRTH